MQRIIVDNAKIMAKGQITLPKDIREKLRLSTGDRVTFICEGDKVTMMNSAVYAMQMLQKDMEGQAIKAGFSDDASVMEYIAEMRAESENE